MKKDLLKITGIALIALLPSCEEAYNGQHRDQFSEALARKTAIHVEPDSDRRLSSKAQKRFLNDFLETNGFVKIDGKRGIYDSEGKEVPYKKLTHLIKNYAPSK
jgi:hypothetical protein